MSHSDKSWEKALNPETLRGNMIGFALFITAYESFKYHIIDKPKVFFSDGFDQDGLIIGSDYKEHVLSLDKSALRASLLWFKNMEAISDADLETFQKILNHRNELSHELPSYLTQADKNLDTDLFQALIDLLAKIEKWWFINFELGIDPEMLPDGANPEDVIPGPIWGLQLMIDIATGNEPHEGFYYEGLRKDGT